MMSEHDSLLEHGRHSAHRFPLVAVYVDACQLAQEHKRLVKTCLHDPASILNGAAKILAGAVQCFWMNSGIDLDGVCFEDSVQYGQEGGVGNNDPDDSFRCYPNMANELSDAWPFRSDFADSRIKGVPCSGLKLEAERGSLLQGFGQLIEQVLVALFPDELQTLQSSWVSFYFRRALACTKKITRSSATSEGSLMLFIQPDSLHRFEVQFCQKRLVLFIRDAQAQINCRFSLANSNSEAHNMKWTESIGIPDASLFVYPL